MSDNTYKTLMELNSKVTEDRPQELQDFELSQLLQMLANKIGNDGELGAPSVAYIEENEICFKIDISEFVPNELIKQDLPIRDEILPDVFNQTATTLEQLIKNGECDEHNILEMAESALQSRLNGFVANDIGSALQEDTLNYAYQDLFVDAFNEYCYTPEDSPNPIWFQYFRNNNYNINDFPFISKVNCTYDFDGGEVLSNYLNVNTLRDADWEIKPMEAEEYPTTLLTNFLVHIHKEWKDNPDMNHIVQKIGNTQINIEYDNEKLNTTIADVQAIYLWSESASPSVDYEGAIYQMTKNTSSTMGISPR